MLVHTRLLSARTQRLVSLNFFLLTFLGIPVSRPLLMNSNGKKSKFIHPIFDEPVEHSKVCRAGSHLIVKCILFLSFRYTKNTRRFFSIYGLFSLKWST